MYRFLLTVLTAVALAGCGSPTSVSGAPADVTFAQQMVPHHEQAVEMSRLALDPERGASEPVRNLATRIEKAQQPEIDEMTGWLDGWGEDASAHGSHGDGDHEMAGMMSDDQMSALEQATGTDFDRRWLQMMIEHHEGAVEMAETEIADGQDSRAKALARAIVDAQRAEITQMKELLR